MSVSHRCRIEMSLEGHIEIMYTLSWEQTFLPSLSQTYSLSRKMNKKRWREITKFENVYANDNS